MNRVKLLIFLIPMILFGYYIRDTVEVRIGTDTLFITNDQIWTTGDLHLYSNAMRGITICQTTGNVGIATASCSPDHTLYVAGRIKFEGAVEGDTAIVDYTNTGEAKIKTQSISFKHMLGGGAFRKTEYISGQTKKEYANPDPPYPVYTQGWKWDSLKIDSAQAIGMHDNDDIALDSLWLKYGYGIVTESYDTLRIVFNASPTIEQSLINTTVPVDCPKITSNILMADWEWIWWTASGADGNANLWELRFYATVYY
ncbi:MAG: hypothetical protein ABEK36_04005 [Candidatus Aenigmatarchaeota archaeon]